MRTVDEILQHHDQGLTRQGPESQVALQRFSRRRHIETVRQLSRVNGWQTTGWLLLHWGLIVASLAAVVITGHWAVAILATIVVATRMQGLGVMLHDATHYLLYRNRTVNDVVSDLCIAFPLGLSTTLYRKTHYRHHRFTNSDEDQDLAAMRQEAEWFEWPKTRWRCAWTLLRTLLGFNSYKAWILLKHWAPWMHLRDPLSDDFPLRSRVLYVLSTVVVYACLVSGLMYAPWATVAVAGVYFVAGFCLMNLINHLRAAAEHLGVAQTHELNATRTVIPHWWERAVLAPHGISYHLEHHLFPSVPGNNLPRLHQHLMADPEFAETAHLTNGYTGVLRELMTPTDAEHTDVSH